MLQHLVHNRLSSRIEDNGNFCETMYGLRSHLSNQDVPLQLKNYVIDKLTNHHKFSILAVDIGRIWQRNASSIPQASVATRVARSCFVEGEGSAFPVWFYICSGTSVVVRIMFLSNQKGLKTLGLGVISCFLLDLFVAVAIKSGYCTGVLTI